MLGAYVENVRKNTPLVHNITNYVTVNDAVSYTHLDVYKRQQ